MTYQMRGQSTPYSVPRVNGARQGTQQVVVDEFQAEFWVETFSSSKKEMQVSSEYDFDSQ